MNTAKRPQLNIRLQPGFKEALDDWRSQQRPIPTTTEAIVTLCMRAIRDDSEPTPPKRREKSEKRLQSAYYE